MVMSDNGQTNPSGSHSQSHPQVPLQEEIPMLELSKVRQSNDSTRLSSNTLCSASSYIPHLSQSTPSCLKIQPSPMSNVPKASSFMRADSSKLLLPKHKPSPEGNITDPSKTGASTLLQRMGLGNQTLMARLGLPLKPLPNPTQTIWSCSN